jgi:hypothetical protein
MLDRWLSGTAPASLPASVSGPAPSNGPMGQPAAATGASLAELLPTKTAQMILDTFADALGVTLVITDMQGYPLTQVSNPCGLYSALLRDADAVARCIDDWQRVAGQIPLEPRFSPNDLGLLCARGLIRSGNELRGMLFMGGIAPEAWPPSPEQMAALSGRFGVPGNVVGDHIMEAHCLDRQQRERALRLVQRVADIISQLLEEHGALSARLQTIASLFASMEGQARR